MVENVPAINVYYVTELWRGVNHSWVLWKLRERQYCLLSLLANYHHQEWHLKCSEEFTHSRPHLPAHSVITQTQTETLTSDDFFLFDGNLVEDKAQSGIVHVYPDDTNLQPAAECVQPSPVRFTVVETWSQARMGGLYQDFLRPLEIRPK